MPSLGSDMEAGTLAEWWVKAGDRVRRGDIIAVVSTDKGDIEVEVWEDGVVEKLLVEPGTTVPVETPLAVLADGKAEPREEQKPSPPPTPKAVLKPERRLETRRVKASPLARRMAAELGVDLATVEGTGPGGAIRKEDIERARPQAPPPTDGLRRAIAAAMARSNREIPHYYLKTRIDMSRALAWLAEKNASLTARERILPVALQARAVVKALARVPELNAFWREDQHQVQEAVHLGFTVSLKAGGVVNPAIIDAHKLALTELMAALSDLIERARRGRLRSSEMEAATITLTNLGDRGVEEVYGVIYPPQVALVGFGKVLEQPWAEQGMLGVRPVVCATLAADHRATDGRVGARLLETLDALLQQPDNL